MRRGLVAVVAVAVVGWAGHRAVRGPGPVAGAGTQRDVTHWRVPLDRAAVADLELLPGVGPTLALRVGEVCAEPTPTRARDLLRVARLGPTGRQRIAPWVVFGAAPDAGDERAETTPPGPSDIGVAEADPEVSAVSAGSGTAVGPEREPPVDHAIAVSVAR